MVLMQVAWCTLAQRLPNLFLYPLKLQPVTTQMHQRWLRPLFNERGHRCVGNRQLNQCKLSFNSINKELETFLQLLRSNLKNYKFDNLTANKALVTLEPLAPPKRGLDPRLGTTDLEYHCHTLRKVLSYTLCSVCSSLVTHF